jgi:rod shape-determining protein MreC
VAISRRAGRSRFTLALLVLTSVTVLTLDFRGSSIVTTARNAAATVFSPVRGAAQTVVRPFDNAWHGIFDYGDVRAQNEALRKQIEDLRGHQAESEDATQQLAEIAKADGLPITTQLPHVLARVVGGPLSSFEHTVQIGKGAGDGIKVGMPVVTGAGLVGRVVQATGSSAIVELITSPDFVAGVRLMHTGEVGLSTGSGEGRPLHVDSIAPAALVPPDETVMTSDYARAILPADIPVGHVTAVELSSDQREQLLAVEPFVDLRALSYVTVLLWEPPP